MKRLTIALSVLTLMATSSLSTASADGMPEQDSPKAPTSADAQEAARKLDMAAAEARGSMGEPPAIQQVEPEILSAAIGHFARARSLLIAALREFDQGYKLAKPDSILDSKEWRSDLISRAEDLERVLSPQARASRFSVRYDADPRLLGAEAK